MRRRKQRRHRAVLPVKIVINGKVLTGHTVDISAFGARVIVCDDVPVDSIVSAEFKHRRSPAKVQWCRPVKWRKYEHELALNLQYPGLDFWGVKLPTSEPDAYQPEFSRLPMSGIVSLVRPKKIY